MEFTATGELHGKRVSITWADGEFVDGDPEAIDFFTGLARGFEGKPLSVPTGPTSWKNHLQDPLAVGALLMYGFQGDVQFSGEVPQLPATPPGTIA